MEKNNICTQNGFDVHSIRVCHEDTIHIRTYICTYTYVYICTHLLFLLCKQQIMIKITDTMIITIIPSMAAPAITAIFVSPKNLCNIVIYVLMYGTAQFKLDICTRVRRESLDRFVGQLTSVTRTHTLELKIRSSTRVMHS